LKTTGKQIFSFETDKNANLLNSLSVVADAIDSSGLEFLKAFLGEIVGTTIMCVLAGQIRTVEILKIFWR